MEPDIPCISSIGHNAYRDVRMARRPDLSPVKRNQRHACADFLSFLHQVGESVPFHIHGVNPDMQQKLHAVCQP